MADESGKGDSNAGDAAAGAAALSIALGAAHNNERVAAKLEAYLEQQTEVLRLQKEEMQEETGIRRWSLRIRHFSDVMKVAFELSLAFICVAIAIGFGAALWNAARDKGVVIESFSVPPDMTAKGLTGEVVAAKLLDRLSSLQAQTTSSRAASSYTDNWGGDIKVQIPDTGVSIGEFYRYLRSWLGHERRISGEVYRTDQGIAVTARAGSDTGYTFTGKDADLDKLIQQAAEAVYKSTQPYRYAVYLEAHGREKEAEAVFDRLIDNGSVDDRAWAYIGLSTIYTQHGNLKGADDVLRRSIAIKPNLLLSYDDLANNESSLQHDEQQLDLLKQAVAVGKSGVDPSLDSFVAVTRVLQDESFVTAALGDFAGAMAYDRQLLELPDNVTWENSRVSDVAYCASMHDAECTDQLWAALPPSNDLNVKINRAATLMFVESFLERWHAAHDLSKPVMAMVKNLGPAGQIFNTLDGNPTFALVDAHLGDLKSAHALIDTTPPDCAVCLRIRGRIDELEKNWNGADYWFVRAVATAPSVPFGDTDWAHMLLSKRDPDDAIVKVVRAHAKAPKFADPLEMWGEALAMKGRADLALAKFAEAARYAPHWGRLHLKWGEALYHAGRKNDAKAQFALASHFSLATDERAELAKAAVRK